MALVGGNVPFEGLEEAQVLGRGFLVWERWAGERLGADAGGQDGGFGGGGE